MLSNECILKHVKECDSDEPFYIIDLSEIEDAYFRWKKCLPDIQPYYAMKCNPNQVIVALLYELGCSFDCASKSEIQQILEMSGDPSRIIYAHPCKYPSHLQYAEDNGVDLMTFDCEEELYKIKKYHPSSRLLLRLAVDDSHSLCKFNVKFGCHSDNIQRLLKLAKSMGLCVTGFSFHVGSGCKSADTYYDALRICKDAMQIAVAIGHDVKIIDVGGGFIAHVEDDCVTFEDIAQKIRDGQKDFFQHDNIQFIAEPGRFMVQKSHTLVLNVIAKKQVKDTFIYYLNDGVYGSFNCIIFDHQNPEIIPLTVPMSSKLYQSQIFGNTCDSLDEIKKCVWLPELQVGDYVYVRNFGAYTTSAKSDGFNGYKVTNYEYVYSTSMI